MDATDAPEPLHDLGILFVHGIGQSAQGETLVHFGEPLRAAVERLAAPAAGPSAAARPGLTRVTSAWLSDADAARPARAELRIDGVAPRPGARNAAAASTSSRIAADAYLDWLDKHYKDEVIAALPSAVIDGLGTLGLVRLAQLLRRKEPRRARALLEEAARRPDTEAAEAIAELHGELLTQADPAAVTRLLDDTAGRDAWFVGKVADALQKRHYSVEAEALRARVHAR